MLNDWHRLKTINNGINHSAFLPTLSLFIAGIAFSYLSVFPFTIDFLYRYGQSLVLPLFSISAISCRLCCSSSLGLGIAFELPIIMYAISLTRLIDPKFWRHNFRYATIIYLVYLQNFSSASNLRYDHIL